MTASPFVIQWAPALVTRAASRRRALDVAMGRGRHSIVLAEAGFNTFGVDLKFDAVRDGVSNAKARGLRLRAWCADLTQYPLPRGAFDLVLVTRYLQRDLFGSLREAVAPGGFVMYETFSVAQRTHGVGPKSPEHLLLPGELRELFNGFDVVFYEEVLEPEALARIVARKEARPSSLA